MFSLLDNWNWEMLYEKQLSNKSITECAKIIITKFTIQHKTIDFWQKDLKTNYTFLNQHVIFINSRNKKSRINFSMTLTKWPYEANIDILETFSTIKVIPEVLLEHIRTSTIKLSCNFLKEAPPQCSAGF